MVWGKKHFLSAKVVNKMPWLDGIDHDSQYYRFIWLLCLFRITFNGAMIFKGKVFVCVLV